MRYAHRPIASGLHAKLRDELSATSPYLVAPSASGLPNAVRVLRHGVLVWSGHRDLMPDAYNGAGDPLRLLSRPSSD